MLKSVCVLFSIFFVAPLASAEAFKCVGKYGEALIRIFPASSVDGRDANGCPRGAKEITRRADAEAALVLPQGQKKSPAAPAEPQIGMTTEEVRAIWGEPTDSHWEEPGDGDLSELWSYGASRSVRFDRKRRVAAISQ